MPRHRYRKALAALALAACLWALPAAAETPAAQTPESAAGTAAQSTPAAGRLPGGLTTTAGGVALVGVGAYSFVRRQWRDERDRRRTETRQPVYFENHTRNGTLRPEERNDLE